jgi:hypothetical protein
MTDDEKIFEYINESDPPLDLMKTYEIKEGPSITQEEIFDIVSGVAGGGTVKNIFKLGKEGFKAAKTFMKTYGKVGRKQGNKEVYMKATNDMKKMLNTDLSMSKITDMAHKRVALEKRIVKAKKWMSKKEFNKWLKGQEKDSGIYPWSKKLYEYGKGK